MEAGSESKYADTLTILTTGAIATASKGDTGAINIKAGSLRSTVEAYRKDLINGGVISGTSYFPTASGAAGDGDLNTLRGG